MEGQHDDNGNHPILFDKDVDTFGATYVTGQCAIGDFGDHEYEVAIVAPDMEQLKCVWCLLFKTKLDVELTQKVRIYANRGDCHATPIDAATQRP